MRFLVDELPYYKDFCPFENICWKSNTKGCPEFWNKDFINSENNPHCCAFLTEENDSV